MWKGTLLHILGMISSTLGMTQALSRLIDPPFSFFIALLFVLSVWRLGFYLKRRDDDPVVDLAPAYANAYNNRGVGKEVLGRIDEAREDYQRAFALAQEADDKNLVARVKRNLHRLDNNAALGPRG